MSWPWVLVFYISCFMLKSFSLCFTFPVFVFFPPVSFVNWIFKSVFLLHSVGSVGFLCFIVCPLRVPALVPLGLYGLILVFVFVCSSVLESLQPVCSLHLDAWGYFSFVNKICLLLFVWLACLCVLRWFWLDKDQTFTVGCSQQQEFAGLKKSYSQFEPYLHGVGVKMQLSLEISLLDICCQGLSLPSWFPKIHNSFLSLSTGDAQHRHFEGPLL